MSQDIFRKKRFQLHSAVTIMPDDSTIVTDFVRDPRSPGGIRPVYHNEGKEQEIVQLACEWNKGPVPETYFRKAFREMEEGCLRKARDAGLVI